jgi:transcriptional regulator with GAF, ATPase, and Fis domain
VSVAPASIDEILASISQLAAVVVPGADVATVTSLDRDGSRRSGASSSAGRAMADFEDSLGEGPCADAARGSATTIAGELGGDPRWPRFGPRAGRLGLHSALALPLARGVEIIGVLGLFAGSRNAFDAEPDQIMLSLAAVATATVANTQVVERSILAVADLERALTSRAVIDQAIGILMSRSGVTEDQAFDRLRVMSQDSDVKLAEIARRLVHQARTRARRRTGGSAPDPAVPDQRPHRTPGPAPSHEQDQSRRR